MPRYKDSPEVRAAQKERKEKLREFLQLLDVEDYSDLRSVFKEMVDFFKACICSGSFSDFFICG